MTDPSPPSLEKYFSGAESPENFFDQIPPSHSSAMMTSMVESKSTQDLFQVTPEPEPVVCKIFSQEAGSDKTFFDIISPTTTDGEANNNSVVSEGPYPSPLQGFEDMSDALNGAESDRTRDAWIASEATRRALILAATSPPGSHAPDKSMLTLPGVVLQVDLVDPVTQLLRDRFGEGEASTRKVLTVNDVPKDERGLRELIQAECYRAAVNLTSRLLTTHGQGINKQGQLSKHTVHSIQLWFTRLSLLVKLQAFKEAEAEARPWIDLDKPDLYYQFYPELYGGRPGTMVPFQMRILLGTLPAYLGQHSVALDRLYAVLAVVRRILTNLENGRSEDGSLLELNPKERDISKQVWLSREARVQHSIVNVSLMSKNYLLAIEVLQNLIRKNTSPNQKRALQSALGRVLLQLGDIRNAEICFSIAKQLKQSRPGTLSSSADLRELVDRGMLLIAQNKYKDAFETFHKASLLDPPNVMVLNNMAVCLLYQGEAKKALELLTSAITSHPELALHESLLLNLCTLHELESFHISQKEALLRLVARYKGDGVNVSCLKIPDIRMVK